MSDPRNISTTHNPVGRFMVAVGSVIELGTSGAILLLKRRNDLDWHPSEWEICYGRLAQFEDLETGLRREVKEELGIEHIEIVRVLSAWHIFRGSKKSENELIGITFHCQTDTERVLLSDEHSAYCWMDPKKALDLITTDGIRRDIIEYIQGQNM